MSPALTAAALWVLAATVTAFLPRVRQFRPGVTLLVLAPLLLVWIGLSHGVLWALVGLAGFLSMFRHPLIYLLRRMSGLPAGSSPERQPDGGRREEKTR